MRMCSLIALVCVSACAVSDAAPSRGADAAHGEDAPAEPAATDDAPLACAPLDTDEAPTVPRSLDEISGIVADPRDPTVLWAIEDSGNPATITALGPDGVPRGVATVSNATNVDWEDLAVGPCGEDACLYIADIGDNRARRASLVILRVPLPALDADTELRAERMVVQWPEGPRDAEALVVFDDATVLLLSKAPGTTRLAGATFRASERAVPLTDYGSLSLDPWRPGGLVTAADWTDGQLLLRLYSDVIVLRDVRTAADLRDAPSQVLPKARELQGESIAWTAAGYATVSEGDRPPIFFFTCDDGLR